MSNRKANRNMTQAEVNASATRDILAGLTSELNEIQERPRNKCRACDNTRGNKLVPGFHSVYSCGACEALFGNCYLGDSYTLVLPHFHSDPNFPADQQRYFDFSTLGSNGNQRRHGWFDPQTKLITQVG